MIALNGPTNRVSGIADDARRAAECATVAGAAFDLPLIDRHNLREVLYVDPLARLAFILLYDFRRQHPEAKQAPAGELMRFAASSPRWAGFVRQNSDPERPGTICQAELASLFSSGWHDVEMMGGNVATLQALAFQRAKREIAAELEGYQGEPAAFFEHARRRLAGLEETAIGIAERKLYDIVTARELAENEYPLAYAIPGVLVEGQPAVVGGVKKCLKTSVLVDLFLSLASKSKFLGEFYVTRRYRACLMSGESGVATLKETAERIAKTKPWFRLEDYTDLSFSFSLPKLGLPNTAGNLVKFIRDNGLEFLGVDPLYLAMQAGDGASNLYSMGDKLSPLTEVIAETGCTICVAHHARKVMKSDHTRFMAPELDDLAFAGIAEWARQWLLLGRRSEYDPENGGHHELWLASGGSAGHSGLWAIDIQEGTRQDQDGRRWEVVVSRAAEARKEAADAKETAKAERERGKQQRDEQRLLDAYKTYPQGETAKQLRLVAGMNPDRFDGINFTLRQRGVVVPCMVPKGSKNHPGFILKVHTKPTQGNEGNEGNESPAVPAVPVGEEGNGTAPLLRGPSSSVPLPLELATENAQSEIGEIRSPADEDTSVTPSGKRKPRKKPSARKASA